jgi:hypothetical protein
VLSGAIEDNIEIIREILGGDISITLNQKFAVVEQRFDRELQMVREQQSHAIDALEQWIKQEVSALRVAINTELGEHRTLRESGFNDLRAVLKDLQVRFTQISQDVNAQLRDLREQMSKQSRVLSAELIQKNQDFQKEFEKILSEFELRKTDRKVLGGVFRSMARIFDFEPGKEPSKHLSMEQQTGQVVELRSEAKKKSG